MRRALSLFMVLVAFGVGGCYQHIRPSGAAPLRYRDEVFSEVTVTADIVYTWVRNRDGPGANLYADMYEPAGDTSNDRPVLILAHSGAFNSGSRTASDIVDEAMYFAKRGYVVYSISYRLHPEGCLINNITVGCQESIADATDDAQTAVRFVRARSYAHRTDPDRIAFGGTSAGAIMALNVAYKGEEPGPGQYAVRDSNVAAAVALAGARFMGTVDGNDAPTLLFHSTEDFALPYQFALNTVEAANTAGAISVMTTWDEFSHGPYFEHRTEILTQTANFLYRFLDLANADQ